MTYSIKRLGGPAYVDRPSSSSNCASDIDAQPGGMGTRRRFSRAD